MIKYLPPLLISSSLNPQPYRPRIPGGNHEYHRALLLTTTPPSDTAFMRPTQASRGSRLQAEGCPADEVTEAVRLVHDGGMIFKGDKFRELLEKAHNLKNGEVLQTHNLPEREMGIVRLVARGISNLDINVKLQISERTVRNHLGPYLTG